MQAKVWEQEVSRQLRRMGWPLREIADELGVSLGSAHLWTASTSIETPEPPAPPPRDEPRAHCGGCERTLPISSFHRGQARCKDCRRTYIHGRGKLHNRQVHAAKSRRRVAARRYILDLLSRGACRDCGTRDPIVLEFDHLGNKTSNVATLVTGGYALHRIEREIAQCELVCVNCHRRRTARRAGSWRTDPERRIATDTRHLRQRNLAYVIEVLRGAGCTDCGEEDLIVLEFDHVGSKRNSVMNLVLQEHSIASIKREIAECEIRCANCHRRRTCSALNHFRHHLLTPP